VEQGPQKNNVQSDNNVPASFEWFIDMDEARRQSLFLSHSHGQRIYLSKVHKVVGR
jgi:hypothetical protein